MNEELQNTKLQNSYFLKSKQNFVHGGVINLCNDEDEIVPNNYNEGGMKNELS
jgi:hypothetical protein